MDSTIPSILAAALAALLTVIGSWVVKRTKSPEAPTREDKLMDEWQDIASEARQELDSCREDRRRQDQVIESQGERITAQGRRIEKLEEAVADFRRELGQWRLGQRVPEGYVLQRAPLPPAGT